MVLEFVYEEIPDKFRYRFVINEKESDTRVSYHQTIAWMRQVATWEGARMDMVSRNFSQAIRGMNYDKEKKESPLFEVEAAYGEQSVKLLFFRANMYLVGFVVPRLDEYYQFKFDEYKIKGLRTFIDLPHEGRYSTPDEQGKPSGPKIGPAVLINAIKALNLRSPNYRRKSRKAETFFLHFSEAARFKAIENQIGQSILKSYAEFDRIEDGDIIRESEEKFQINCDHSDSLPYYFYEVIKSHRKLSKAWLFHFFSEGRCESSVSASLVDQCHLFQGVDSLKSTLGTVCNINQKKFLDELEKKVSMRYTKAMYEDSEKKVTALADKKLAFGDMYDWSPSSES